LYGAAAARGAAQVAQAARVQTLVAITPGLGSLWRSCRPSPTGPGGPIIARGLYLWRGAARRALPIKR